MAFRKKADAIMSLRPDILIVPECECLENLNFIDNIPKPTNMLWFGKNRHKGLAIFSFGAYRLEEIAGHNEELKIIIPIVVTGGSIIFNLLAIWANNPTDKEGQYVTQVWKALKYYEQLIADKQTVLMGDFNSNTIWDRPGRVGNHSDVVSAL